MSNYCPIHDKKVNIDPTDFCTCTPTTPSEWEQIKIDVDEVLYDLTDHTLTFDEASAMMLNIVKQLLHHNTEDIIGQVASKLDWIVENMENYSSNSRARKNLINDALKPTHKE